MTVASQALSCLGATPHYERCEEIGMVRAVVSDSDTCVPSNLVHSHRLGSTACDSPSHTLRLPTRAPHFANKAQGEARGLTYQVKRTSVVTCAGGERPPNIKASRQLYESRD